MEASTAIEFICISDDKSSLKRMKYPMLFKMFLNLYCINGAVDACIDPTNIRENLKHN